MIKEQKEDHGGWAGIRVPSNEKGKAELDLFGEGMVIAIGGNAGKGNIPTGVYGGRWRTGGAGAGIGRKPEEKVEMLIVHKLGD